MSEAPDASSTKVDGASVVVALLLAGLAGVIAWDASRLSNNNVYGVGPAAMPYVVAVGLGILAIGNLIGGFRGGLPPRESADPKTVLLILGGLNWTVEWWSADQAPLDELVETALTMTRASLRRRA